MTFSPIYTLVLLVLTPFFVSAPEQEVGIGNNNLNARLATFEKNLEDLRAILKTPGMSAAVVKDQRLIWSKGFGLADREKNIPATADTPYRIASLTKTFASTLLMQLVEQGKVSLDDPMSKYSKEFTGDAVTVRHVLSHTSEGTPGARYSYNGNRFASLDAVIEKGSGKPFRQLLTESILDKLEMRDSVPGQDVLTVKEFTSRLPSGNLKRYEESLSRLAVPYTLYGKDELIRSGYPMRSISTSAGLISTVNDLAKFDAALDRNVFIRKETQQLAWTSMRANDGRVLPYGLGWFVQDYQGDKLVWHYGQWPVFSALILKVPKRQLTLILLANDDGLSTPFGLGGGNVISSPFAVTFLRQFLFEDRHGCDLPPLDWKGSAEQVKEQAGRLVKESKGYDYRNELNAHDRIHRYLNGRAARVRAEVRVDPQHLDAFVGTYRQSNDLTVTVKKEGDRLTYQRTYEQDGRQYVFDKETLYPMSETSFFDKTMDAQATFIKDEAGKVLHLVLRISNRDQKLPKVN